MFAPDADAAIREMTRVTRPGGAVAMTAWHPEGYIGSMLKISSSFLPPPPEGVNTPNEWGDEATARERFGRYLDEIEVRQGTITWQYETKEEARKSWEEEAPPTVAAKMILPPEKFEEMRTKLEEMETTFDRGTDGRVVVDADYLMIMGRKRAK
jgi:hypothetical protein